MPPLPVAPRPLWLLGEPQPLAALLERQPWVLREGPERIESGWWDGRDVRRDYYVAENPNGEIVWIYRDHRYGTDDGEWFLHGVFARSRRDGSSATPHVECAGDRPASLRHG